MLFKLFFLSFATVVWAQGSSLDGLINDVFTKDPKNLEEAPCNNGAGVCVKFYLCPNGTLNTDGDGIIDIRIDEEGGECGDYLLECCPTGGVNREAKPPPYMPPHQTPPPYTPPHQTQPPYTPPHQTQPPYTPPHQTGPSQLIKPTEKPSSGIDQNVPSCGYRNVEGVGFRITGDHDGESQFGEWPWMAAVLKSEMAADQVFDVYQCGGSLIHPSVVLTAAHCVQSKNPTDLKVRLGEWDTQTSNELYPHVDRKVQDFVFHKDFNKGSLYNDVALLFLKEPVEFAPNINTVCLPPQDTSSDYSRCFASGWGKDVFGKEGKYQVILKKVELPVVPYQQCQDSLRKTRLGQRYMLHKSFICAGGETGKDTCRGDGGSPLVCPIPGREGYYYQSGIVAWGIGCGESNTPGVYANVAHFRNWIDQQIQLRGLKPI